MIRTQIQLQEPIYDRIRALAARQHRSMAACMRDAIVAFVAQDEASADGLTDIAGKFRPLPMDQVKEHDRQWADATLRKGRRR